MSKMISLFGLILTTTCDAQAVGKYDKAGTETACAAGVIADTCDKDATLKVLKSVNELCASCNGFSAAPAVTTAAQACTACPPYTQSSTGVTGHFPNAAGTTGCGDCAANCFACTSASVCTQALNGYYLDSGAPKACVEGSVSLCTAHATLKILKTGTSGGSDPTVGLCPGTGTGSGDDEVFTGSTLTATPAVDTAEKACQACETTCDSSTYKCTAHFPNAADTEGCGDCADNCDACTSASVCTAASHGYFLNSGVPAACTAAADGSCDGNVANANGITLKLLKNAFDLCPAGNTFTASPAVDGADKACKACEPGTTPNDKDVGGCKSVAGMCAGNFASATNLDTQKQNGDCTSATGCVMTYEYSCGCPLKMVLKPSASTIKLSGADDAARDAVCCDKYVAPPPVTTTTTTAAPAAPAAAATKAGPAPGPELGSATSLSLAAGVLIVTAAAFANLM